MRFVWVFSAVARLLLHCAPLVLMCSAAYSQGSAGTVGAAGEREGNQASPQFALLVGVDYYVDPTWNTLHAPGNDVAMMKAVLIHRYHFADDPEHMMLLIGQQATRKAIEDGFRQQLVAKAKKYPNATFVFYYSGHGSLSSDGLHETIVPSDGRTPGVFDITDDDLSDLFDDLLRYTTKEAKITFILDSCHSGTIIKGLDSSLISKEIPPDPRPQPKAHSQNAAHLISKDLGTGVLPRNDSFVALAAAYSYESAFEDCLPDKVGGFSLPRCQVAAGGGYRPFSLFTFFLAQTLESSPNITYRQATDQIASVISRRARQHPNVEGDGGRPMFGISGDREDPFINIVGAISGKTFTVDAGAIQGLEEGTFLAIYKPQAVKLTGGENKICNARVITVDDFTATAELSEIPKTPLPQGSKVGVVTPYFGGRRLRVRLDANPASTLLTEEEKRFIQSTADILKDNRLVEIVANAGREVGRESLWDVGLQKGFLTRDGRPCSDHCGEGATRSFYLVTPDRNEPLYGFSTLSSDSDGARKVSETLTSRVRQENLRAIVNARSPLNSLVKLGIIKVDADAGSDGVLKIKGEEELSGRELVSLPIGQRIRLKIENNSDADLNVVLIDLGTSGGISLLTPRGVGITIQAHKTFTTHQVFRVGGPAGLETYKVIAYTVPVGDEPVPNFAVLEQKGMISLAPKDVSSPLGWLFSQAVAGMAKDTSLDSQVDLKTWTVSQLDVYLK